MDEEEKVYIDAYNDYMEKYSKKLGKEEAHKRATLLVEAIKRAKDDLKSGKIVIDE